LPAGIYLECDIWYVRVLENIIETHTFGDIAAFVAEPILGGFIVPPDENPLEVQKMSRDPEIWRLRQQCG
jgi:adenosylmethionine-8-amino-7-oxononanoate aminotransferase